MFAAIVLGVAGIMWIFDAIWTFRYHGCSRRISKVRSSGTVLRPATESISSWLPCSSWARSSCSAGRGWVGGPESRPGRSGVSPSGGCPATQYGPWPTLPRCPR